MAQISDLSQPGEWTVQTTLKERFGHDVDVRFADADSRVSPSDRKLTSRPVLRWQERGCHFVICKRCDRRYRCPFYDTPYKQFGTNVSDYDDLSECTVALLQAQADHLAEERAISTGNGARRIRLKHSDLS